MTGVLRLFGVAALVSAAASFASPLPVALADPCPDVEVVFARGTGGDGLGVVGQAFVNAVRAKTPGRSVATYLVNYPASLDFDSSAPLGAADAAARVQWMADNCPATKLVLSGISQGAGAIDLITVDPRPLGRFAPTPMPPQLAPHVAAVAVFGNPMRKIPGAGALTQLSSGYGAKSIDLCAPDDIFCSAGSSLAAHFSYVQNGMVDQAADFVAGRLQ